MEIGVGWSLKREGRPTKGGLGTKLVELSINGAHIILIVLLWHINRGLRRIRRIRRSRAGGCGRAGECVSCVKIEARVGNRIEHFVGNTG